MVLVKENWLTRAWCVGIIILIVVGIIGKVDRKFSKCCHDDTLQSVRIKTAFKSRSINVKHRANTNGDWCTFSLCSASTVALLVISKLYASEVFLVGSISDY